MKKLFLRESKGFTLIELLVVVAIIGILSSVVLTSLGSARKKAKMAAVKSEMSSLIKQAEILRGSDGKFPPDICVLDGPLEKLTTAIQNNAGISTVCTTNESGQATPKSSNKVANNSVTKWRIYVKTSNIDKPNTFYCADSNGYIGIPEKNFICGNGPNPWTNWFGVNCQCFSYN